MKTTRTDAERLDYLEREANLDPIVLHAMAQPALHGFRGLGLKNTGRSLRQALDDMMAILPPSGDNGG